ncbi:MAG: hypothetical protein ACE5IJ_06740 [Thermoplasmata archaeon]
MAFIFLMIILCVAVMMVLASSFALALGPLLVVYIVFLIIMGAYRSRFGWKPRRRVTVRQPLGRVEVNASTCEKCG